MAMVYKAYDTHLEHEVAVKVIRIDDLPRSAEERALKRFEREAKALAKLDHPNIVKVMDYGEYEGSPYLVMPYLPGGTLKQYFKNKRRLDWREAVGLLLPITRALAYAHDEGVIHRDVKPSNILLTTSGEPMLTDFGVAKVIDEEVTQDLTGTSATVGTPEYMAPEQVISKTVDHRADIYALGVVMFEMVTGRRPYEADTPMAVLFKHASDPLPRPRDLVPDLPEQVEQVLLKALAKKPDDRYQDMGEFTSALKKMEIAEQRIDDSQSQLIKEALSHNEYPVTLNTVDQTEKKHKEDESWAFPANDNDEETSRNGVRVPVAVPPSYDDAVIPEENIDVLGTNLDASQPVLTDSIESRPFSPRYASAYQLTYENAKPSSRALKLIFLIGIGGIVAIFGLLMNLQNRNVMTTGSNSTSTAKFENTFTALTQTKS